MNLDELQERLEECFDAQRENEKVYLKDALKLHQKLNEFIQLNGVTPKTEEMISESLEIIEIYNSFDKKLTKHIETLKNNIEKITN